MSTSGSHITIITPCYNEGEVITRFLEHLEAVLQTLPYRFSVIVADDHSTDNTLSLLHAFRFRAGNIDLHITCTGKNTGHQRAIYTGFVYAQQLESTHIIVMDSDGEDAPASIPTLLANMDADIVNVVRGSRQEPVLFRFMYRGYQLAFRAVTGKQMNYGNFCLIRRHVMNKAVAESFLHLAAFLSRQRGVKRSIVADRKKRIGGTSKMSYVQLLNHAFRSFAEYRNDAALLKILFVSRSSRNRF